MYSPRQFLRESLVVQPRWWAGSCARTTRVKKPWPTYQITGIIFQATNRIHKAHIDSTKKAQSFGCCGMRTRVCHCAYVIEEVQISSLKTMLHVAFTVRTAVADVSQAGIGLRTVERRGRGQPCCHLCDA
jgi:hypothetical protein